jgi:uncharacterized protein (DUF983 family)
VSRPYDPGLARQLGRGVTGRCPRCGSRGLFERWGRLRPSCPRCGLVFDQGDGYWTGAMAMNFVLTGVVFVVVFVALVAATAPHIPVAPLLAVLVPITLVGPVAGYPISKTLWVAVDRALLQRL